MANRSYGANLHPNPGLSYTNASHQMPADRPPRLQPATAGYTFLFAHPSVPTRTRKEPSAVELIEAIRQRHSVRRYTDRPIEPGTVAALQAEVDAANAEGGLAIRLVTGDPDAFSGLMAHYGKFDGVCNYLALAGSASDTGLDEKAGYYGERIALRAQQMGLNSCWVALTFSKGKVRQRCALGPDERLAAMVALGYGATQGVPRKSKPLSALCRVEGGRPMPDWFRAGMEAALLAPTAVNQQKFLITLRSDGTVEAQATGGVYKMIDLGIVKYHFEVGAGRQNFAWA